MAAMRELRRSISEVGGRRLRAVLTVEAKGPKIGKFRQTAGHGACIERLLSARRKGPEGTSPSTHSLDAAIMNTIQIQSASQTEMHTTKHEITRSKHEHVLHTNARNPLIFGRNRHHPSWGRRII